jgi:hypothetical protein
LPLKEAPDRFDQQATHASVAHAINRADAPFATRAVFARTTTGIAADLFAIVEAVPVADLASISDQVGATSSADLFFSSAFRN